MCRGIYSEIPEGTQQTGRWQRPLTGSARVLLFTTQVVATRSDAPGHRCIIIPCVPIMARSLPLADGLILESERPCFLPTESCSLGADGLAVRVSWRFPRMRSRPQECTCCAGYSAVKVHTQGQGVFAKILLCRS